MDNSTTSDTAANADTSDAGTGTSSVQTIFKRVVDGAHETVDGAAAKVAPVVDGLSAAGEKKEEWVGAARDAIREHPFAAIATALLVGAAYSSLTRSRR